VRNAGVWGEREGMSEKCCWCVMEREDGRYEREVMIWDGRGKSKGMSEKCWCVVGEKRGKG
jgi:hypothetical protein